MMKNIAGALLVGLTVLTFTPAAFAGQAGQASQARGFVGGYHVTATDDCAGNMNYLDAAEKPVEVDLGADSARIRILAEDGGEQCYNFNRKAAPLLSYLKECSALPLITKQDADQRDDAADLYQSVLTDKYGIAFIESHEQPVRVI